MGAYTTITGDLGNAIALHDQMLRTAASLMPVAALIEISLRNAVCERLTLLFDAPDWLQEPTASFEWRGEERNAIRKARRHAQQAGYAKRNQHQKRLLDKMAFPLGIPAGLAHEERVRERRRHIPITFGQLVAQLTLSFWKRLFSQDYQSALWDRSLKRLFPDKSYGRAYAAENLEIIYQSRNRAAHHEPLFDARLQSTLTAVDRFVSNFGPKLDDGRTLIEKMTQSHRANFAQESATLMEMVSRFTIKSDSLNDR